MPRRIYEGLSVRMHESCGGVTLGGPRIDWNGYPMPDPVPESVSAAARDIEGDDNIPTPPLADFRQAYEADDNWWWRLGSGDHQNLFDQACERIDELEARFVVWQARLLAINDLRDLLAETHHALERLELEMDQAALVNRSGPDPASPVDQSPSRSHPDEPAMREQTQSPRQSSEPSPGDLSRSEYPEC